MRFQRIAALVLALLVTAACGGRTPTPRGTPGAMAPAEAVERFLRLAAEKDYAEMGYLFGNAEGAVMHRDPPSQVERRMYAIASVLEHRRFAIRQTEQIPGRPNAMRVTVQIDGRSGERQVPFTVVRATSGRWYVEVVDLERLTRSR